jgi:hypothetical protein
MKTVITNGTPSVSCGDAGANASSARYVCCHVRLPSAVPIYEH